MSRFIRCDRCNSEEYVMGTVSMPPGWAKICDADLCEWCSKVVRDFIRFKPSDAERLPVEPIEVIAPVGDKLFETTPEPNAVDDVTNRPMSTEKRGPDASLIGESLGTREQSSSSGTSPASAECSTEERKRQRTKRKLRGQDAILPDVRQPAPLAEDAR